MTNRPFLGTGFADKKARERTIHITLAGPVAHRLPRIARANEAWVADARTAEIELETVGGQRVILELDQYAIENLGVFVSQLLTLRNTD